MSVDLARIEVVQSALAHCYNDRGCVSCPMYDECEGDASMIIGIAADVLAEIIHNGKVNATMNNDLISRKALLEGFDVHKVTEYDESGCGVDYRAVPVDAIMKAPVVDAEPVRHGRWENAKAAFHKKCSHCKCILHMPRERNYCPNCGAKMDGGAKNESN